MLSMQWNAIGINGFRNVDRALPPLSRPCHTRTLARERTLSCFLFRKVGVCRASLAWFIALASYCPFLSLFLEPPSLPTAICTILWNQNRLTRKSPVAPPLQSMCDSDRNV